MLKLFIAWFAIYVFLLIKPLFQIRKIGKILVIIVKYLDSAELQQHPRGYGAYLTQLDNYSEMRGKLLKTFPYIEELLPYYAVQELSYSMDNLNLYENAYKNYQELLMKQNYTIRDFKNNINPLISLLFIVAIPSKLIEWMGFQPSAAISKIINLAGWVASFVIGLYSDEIKLLITTLFQNLTN